jgi:hypothetical protein
MMKKKELRKAEQRPTSREILVPAAPFLTMDDQMVAPPSVVPVATAVTAVAGKNHQEETSSIGGGERERRLGGGGKDNEEEDGYFVDVNGNAYDSYAMAWRYLGLFIDCSDSDSENRGRRDLKDNDNGSSSSSNCPRRLLWAAYVDEQYKGGSIGEYSIFNRRQDLWEMKTCRGQTYWPFTRCQRMDCHHRRTSWKLVGVYKESDGFDDWSEQLFKHHGYCLWNDQEDASQQQDASSSDNSHSRDNEQASSTGSSDYEFMQNEQETWSTAAATCSQLTVANAADGSALYTAVQPLKRGGMTIYTDADCLVPSNKVQYADYLAQIYDDDDAVAYSTSSLLSEWQ